jgi:serine protease
MQQVFTKVYRHFLRVSAGFSLLSFIFLVFLSSSVSATWYIAPYSDSNAAPATSNAMTLPAGLNPVVVAVIDSGVFADHPAIKQRLLPGANMQSIGYNLHASRSLDFNPDSRDASCRNRVISSDARLHGTEVASVIVGEDRNGFFGVNPKARILPIKVAGACGINRQDIMDAIQWAAGFPVNGLPINQYPAQIINLSLVGGADYCTAPMQKVIDQVTKKGVFVVAAAGNNFKGVLKEPGNCNGVIAVGAITPNNELAFYSSVDPRIDIYAPGGGKPLHQNVPWRANKIRVATMQSGVRSDQFLVADKAVGTSFAAPLVSGVLSQFLSQDPSLTSNDLDRILPAITEQVARDSFCSTCEPRRVFVRSMP